MKITKINTVKSLINDDSFRRELSKILPQYLTADKFLRFVLNSVQKNPLLAECTPKSLVGCIMTCASLGWEPDTFLGHCYLIPFKNNKRNCYEAQVWPGYRGYLYLIRKSNDVMVDAHVVYEKDYFVIDYGLEHTLIHRPYLKEDRGSPIGAYCIFRYANGQQSFLFMSYDQIMKLKARSKIKGEINPWTTDEDEMMKIKVIKRLAKIQPISPEFQKAMALENRAEEGETQIDILSEEKEDEQEDINTEEFENLIPENIDRDAFNRYLQEMAHINKNTVEQLKATVLKENRMDILLDAYQKWLSRPKPPNWIDSETLMKKIEEATHKKHLENILNKYAFCREYYTTEENKLIEKKIEEKKFAGEA